VVQNETRLDTCISFIYIEFQKFMHVFCEVQDYGDIAAFSGEARSSSSGKYRGSKLTAECNGSDYVLFGFGQNNADREMAIVGGIGCVECPAATVEAHFTSYSCAEPSR
jgi:hypothetical protein